MKNRFLKIRNLRFVSTLITSALLLASACSAHATIVTWKFRAEITSVREDDWPTDINGTVTNGTPLTFNFKFDTAMAGVLVLSFPYVEWDYPLIPGQFAADVQFGPFDFASSPSTSGTFQLYDVGPGNPYANDTIGANIVPAAQFAGPDLESGCGTTTLIDWGLNSTDPLILNGNAIPLRPWDISLATGAFVDVFITTCNHRYGIQSQIVAITAKAADPCDELHDLIAQLQGAGLANGTTQSLLAKLDMAAKKICDDNPSNDQQAIGPLQAFQNELAAQSGKKTISAALANSLSAAAADIISSLPH